MIQFIHAPSCGTAIRLALYTSPASTRWRLLRKQGSAPADETDGYLVHEGDRSGQLGTLLDTDDLVNGLEYSYQLFEYIDGWQASADPRSATPAYLVEPLYASPDFVGFVQRRLESALEAEVAGGLLGHTEGFIPVMIGYPAYESVRFPVVTVILEERRPQERGVGEIISQDLWDGSVWSELEGWFDRSTLQIGVWAFNHSERRRLRDSVQRALMLNMPVMASVGYDQIEISERDAQDFESYSAPVFQTLFSLSALHSSVVRTKYLPIDSTEVIVNGDREPV